MLAFIPWFAALWLRQSRHYQEHINASKRLENALVGHHLGSDYNDDDSVNAYVPQATGRMLKMQEEELRRFRRDFRRPVNVT
jgi:hypothetical protein